jgi:hypothetical protein
MLAEPATAVVSYEVGPAGLARLVGRFDKTEAFQQSPGGVEAGKRYGSAIERSGVVIAW